MRIASPGSWVWPVREPQCAGREFPCGVMLKGPGPTPCVNARLLKRIFVGLLFNYPEAPETFHVRPAPSIRQPRIFWGSQNLAVWRALN